jgi:hypothetical protein
MVTRSLGLAWVFVTAALVAPARADSPPIKGTFGFDVTRPKQKCAKVDGALLTKLNKSYTCTKPDSDSASGKPWLASCKAKQGSNMYMLFATAADCNEERETQLANGQGD